MSHTATAQCTDVEVWIEDCHEGIDDCVRNCGGKRAEHAAMLMPFLNEVSDAHPAYRPDFTVLKRRVLGELMDVPNANLLPL